MWAPTLFVVQTLFLSLLELGGVTKGVRPVRLTDRLLRGQPSVARKELRFLEQLIVRPAP